LGFRGHKNLIVPTEHTEDTEERMRGDEKGRRFGPGGKGTPKPDWKKRTAKLSHYQAPSPSPIDYLGKLTIMSKGDKKPLFTATSLGRMLRKRVFPRRLLKMTSYSPSSSPTIL